MFNLTGKQIESKSSKSKVQWQAFYHRRPAPTPGPARSSAALNLPRKTNGGFHAVESKN
jgi:hypothetical protein